MTDLIATIQDITDPRTPVRRATFVPVDPVVELEQLRAKVLATINIYEHALEDVDAAVKRGSRRGNVYYDRMAKASRDMANKLRLVEGDRW